MIELLVDMLHEMKDLKQEMKEVKQEMKEVKQEQIALRQEQIALRQDFNTATELNTQAILSLTALLQKTIIEPAQRQTEDIFDLKCRVTALEQAH